MGLPKQKDDKPLNESQLKEFAGILQAKQKSLLSAAEKTLKTEMELSPDDRMDEVDQASSEYMQSFNFNLRRREGFLLKKIEHALRKIEEGTFGMCEECEDPISLKRLKARPEAPLCINCKEAQEKEEAAYAD